LWAKEAITWLDVLGNLLLPLLEYGDRANDQSGATGLRDHLGGTCFLALLAMEVTCNSIAVKGSTAN